MIAHVLCSFITLTTGLGPPVPAVQDQPAPKRTTLNSARPRAPASSEAGTPRSGSSRIACSDTVHQQQQCIKPAHFNLWLGVQGRVRVWQCTDVLIGVSLATKARHLLMYYLLSTCTSPHLPAHQLEHCSHRATGSHVNHICYSSCRSSCHMLHTQAGGQACSKVSQHLHKTAYDWQPACMPHLIKLAHNVCALVQLIRHAAAPRRVEPAAQADGIQSVVHRRLH